MKYIAIALAFFLATPLFAQEIGSYNEEGNVRLKTHFISKWEYFRFQKNPLIPEEDTMEHGGYTWKIPNLLPAKFYKEGYLPDMKVTRWGIAEDPDRYVSLSANIYLIEKGDGMKGIKWALFATKKLDSIHVNVYDSIFPYDNRFLVAEPEPDQFTFHSGNLIYDPWHTIGRTTGYPPIVEIVGLVRGAQYGVDRVRRQDFMWSREINQLRPEYPNYEYAIAEESYFSDGFILMGGPKGKVDEYVEYIFYSNKVHRTGDSNPNNFYEIRFVIPYNPKTIADRRFIKRKLSEEELVKIRNSHLSYFLDYSKEERMQLWEKHLRENPVKEIIIKRKEKRQNKSK